MARVFNFRIELPYALCSIVLISKTVELNVENLGTVGFGKSPIKSLFTLKSDFVLELQVNNTNNIFLYSKID